MKKPSFAQPDQWRDNIRSGLSAYFRITTLQKRNITNTCARVSVIYRIVLGFPSLGDRDYTLDIVHPGSHSKPKMVISRSIVAQSHQGPRSQSTLAAPAEARVGSSRQVSWTFSQWQWTDRREEFETLTLFSRFLSLEEI